MIITTSVVGVYVFDNEFKLVDKIEFSVEETMNYNKELEQGVWIEPEKKLIAKYKDSLFLGYKNTELEGVKLTQDIDKLGRLSDFFGNGKMFEKINQFNTILTKQGIKASVTNDLFIINTIRNIEDLQRVANIMAKRLREWYELYNPEFSQSIQSHEKFAELILSRDKKELLKDIKLDPKLSMGADVKKEDLEPIKKLASELISVYNLIEEQSKYLEQIMQQTCPNMTAITGAIIGAKLIDKAGSIERLALFPASTIQLLGAEEALFRHLKTGSRCPKYGLLHQHDLVLNSKQPGKAARVIANKISIAIKVDLYKGKFIGDKLKKEIEKKLGKV